MLLLQPNLSDSLGRFSLELRRSNEDTDFSGGVYVKSLIGIMPGLRPSRIKSSFLGLTYFFTSRIR